jgi:hypothetical protein
MHLVTGHVYKNTDLKTRQNSFFPASVAQSSNGYGGSRVEYRQLCDLNPRPGGQNGSDDCEKCDDSHN